MVCRYFVMRDTTERPEGVEAGTLRLVGTEAENIYLNFKELLEDPAAYEKMSHPGWLKRGLKICVVMYGDGIVAKNHE